MDKDLLKRFEGLIPFMTVHPGEILKNELEARGIDMREFAKQTGVKITYLRDLFRGRRDYTLDYAERLEKALGIPAYFWIRLQEGYWIDCIRILRRDESERKAVGTHTAE